MSQKVEYQNFVFFLRDRLDEDEGEGYSFYASPTFDEHRHPAANCAQGVPLYTADFRLRIEPETSRFMAQCSPTRPCGRCIFIPNVCLYTPERPKTSKESKFEKSKNLTLSESEPRSAKSYTVIIPLDHWFIYRNIRNEYINLI